MAENDDMRVPDRAHDARSADLAKASHWQRKGGRLAAAVERRFGVLPNFFGPATANPEITKSLRDFACFAYLDNPLPSLFKERLFVYLARFCDVRCCIGRHVGFLVGLGRPSGDPLSPTRNIAEVLRLVQRPLARDRELDAMVTLLKDRRSGELPGAYPSSAAPKVR